MRLWLHVKKIRQAGLQDENTKKKNKELRKEKNANFQTMIPRELFEEINAFLTERGMTKVDFIKKAFEVMQNNA